MSLVALFSAGASLAPDTQPKWMNAFKIEMQHLDAEYPGQLGVFVRDLQSGKAFSYRGRETWYLASGTKLLVAIEAFRQIEQKKFSLTSKITLKAEDYVDGAGSLNFAEPNSQHTIQHLLEQMLIYSDNTATDLLLTKVGLENVNVLGKKYKFAPITTLADIRRKIYSHLTESANQLKGKDLILMQKAPSDSARVAMLEKLTKIPQSKWSDTSIEKAYITYYAQGWNSATLDAYTHLLAKLLNETILNSTSTKELLAIMERAQSGKKRLRAGLPPTLTFAHKTGTQRRRVCDFGVVRSPEGKALALISACTRGFSSANDADLALNRLAKSLTKSGLFTYEEPKNQ